MIDLTDVTFIIPIYIDSKSREDNLKTMMHYLNYHFDTNIIIHEQNGNLVPGILKDFNYQYMSFEMEGDLIHRTKQLNEMIREVKTPIISNYDCDVLFYPEAYVESAKIIRENPNNFVSPYSGKFYNVPNEYKTEILNSKSLECAEPIREKGTLFHPNSLGGSIFFNKNVYIKGGLENENFMSWGYEDDERINRFKTLGYSFVRVGGNLFHLNHDKLLNSTRGQPYYQSNARELQKVSRMGKGHLEEYIKTWSWAD
jgi:predicted glycosyltransferase involved in capsule biosynthesis